MSATSFNPQDFNLRGDDDFVRVDSLCRELLLAFYHSLLSSGSPPRVATERARSADLFVRDYIVDHLMENPFMMDGVTVRRFAATWYVTSVPEPSISELATHLEGVESFARHLHDDGYLDGSRLDRIVAASRDLDYYASRIESYWELTADRYREWEREPVDRGEEGS